MLRHVDITVIMLDGKRVRRRVRAGPRKRITSEGLEGIVLSAANAIERDFPGREFRLLPLSGASFNFVEVPVPQSEGA
jgi:hypothetical protein